jgi:hypothetical protein
MDMLILVIRARIKLFLLDRDRPVVVFYTKLVITGARGGIKVNVWIIDDSIELSVIESITRKQRHGCPRNSATRHVLTQ